MTSLKKKRKKKENEITPPLHALLQLSLLADLWELFLVVFSHLALLGSASWVVFDALHFLLPRFHQLVVALAELLFLKARRKKNTQPEDTSAEGAQIKKGASGEAQELHPSEQDSSCSFVMKSFNSVSMNNRAAN